MCRVTHTPAEGRSRRFDAPVWLMLLLVATSMSLISAVTQDKFRRAGKDVDKKLRESFISRIYPPPPFFKFSRAQQDTILSKCKALSDIYAFHRKVK